MLDSLRARWPHLFLTIALLLGLNPSAVYRPLVQSLRTTKIALSSGRPDAALDSLEIALTLEPAIGATHREAASFALAIADPERTLVHLDRLVELFPEDTKHHCQRAWAALLQADGTSAEREWRSAKETCVDQVSFLWVLHELYWTDEDFPSARTTLEELIEQQPDVARLRLRLGVLLATSQPKEALTHLESARLLSTEASPLASGLIQAIEDSSPLENRASTLANVGQALAQHDAWNQAVWAFRQALTIDPNFTEARAYLGLALELTGQDGYRELRTAISERPTASLPRIFMAYHYQAIGESEKARRQLAIAAFYDPANPAISAELGLAYAALGDVEAAKSALRMATDLAPRVPDFWLLLAEYSLANEIEVRDLGLPAARNAITLAGQNPSTLDLIGYAHLLLGNLELAERFLWQAVNLQPDRPMTQFHLGLLRQMQGDPSLAKAAWELAARLDPSGAAGELSTRAIENLRSKP